MIFWGSLTPVLAGRDHMKKVLDTSVIRVEQSDFGRRAF